MYNNHKRNTEARSRNHFCREKASSMTYFERVCTLSYPAWQEHAPYFIVVCGSPDAM